jgi:hypothetical protein
MASVLPIRAQRDIKYEYTSIYRWKIYRFSINRNIPRLKCVSCSDVFEFLRHLARSFVQILGYGFLLTQIYRVELLAQISVQHVLRKQNTTQQGLTILRKQNTTRVNNWGNKTQQGLIILRKHNTTRVNY